MFFPSAYQLSANHMASLLASVNEIEIWAASNLAGIAPEVRNAIHEINSNLP
jgi:hypothetical protein